MQNKTQLSLKIVPPSPTSQSGALLLCLGSGSDWRSRLRFIPSSAVLGEDWGPLPLCKSPLLQQREEKHPMELEKHPVGWTQMLSRVVGGSSPTLPTAASPWDRL